MESIPRGQPETPLSHTDMSVSGSDSDKEFNPASATNGGREISRKVLYVGGLPKSINEDALNEKFSASGPVFSVKILNDKNKQGFNYAFVEFVDEAGAAAALQEFNGSSFENSMLKINYAYQSSTFNATQNSDDPTYNIFVGDLSPEVDDESLHKFFSAFESLKQAHVMWDMQTSRSRGYGFVTFANLADAETALSTMNGKVLNGRAIRCNWASHKQQNSRGAPRQNNQRQFRPQYQRPGFNESPVPMPEQNNFGDAQFSLPQRPQQEQQMMPNLAMGPNTGVMSPHSFDIVLRQTPSWQTTVYLGNIAHFTQQNDLIPLLQNFGYIVDFKFHPEKGCAFVKYDTHERAALAIVQLSGFNVNGRQLKCGWGKSRPPMGQFQNYPRN
ncbi:RNA recognition motif family protein [Clavispora lusitaniae]|uniref:RRM domain-containing protein n=2 Tax=Clavispora lusitaniae TaxID=36911 RepID=C4Y987_CLAL4|nr:uncharacterized protein CLUG_04765 [Clavispora lusitaniae ATCC 42720]EEQ40637.1 hypothetical protein CLUG_04765 [Clavispora lusitaniae ATCC 42720]KAF5209442.1 hypothetical protein E0198_003742 [Clavispora lusitaniae]KAF7581451.1 RNA recognition motif family protein [Clavispora lusitaniae]OVF07697.1 putative nuclear and cytoplasmic polyadenylated RNA-binding protein [Clavispora lusitaniae]